MKAMNPSTNDFLAKDEDDEGDTCHQTCTFIGHRVCNPLLQFPLDNDKDGDLVITWNECSGESPQLYKRVTPLCKSLQAKRRLRELETRRLSEICVTVDDAREVSEEGRGTGR